VAGAAVVNASPLIFLAKLERLDALRVFERVLTTPVVVAEVELGLEQGYREALSVQRAIDEGAIVVRRAPELTLPPPRLDPGELSVISLARRTPGSTVVIDDLPAIRAAKHLGLRVRSTPFVLLDNLHEGKMDATEFRGMLERLVGLDYYLSASLLLFLMEAAQRLERR